MHLPLHNLHRWDVSPEEAIAIQHSLANKVSLVPDLREVKVVGGRGYERQGRGEGRCGAALIP